MSYNTIGISGLDLLLLTEELRREFLSRISRMPSQTVYCLATDLQFARNVIRENFKDSTLVRDPSTLQFKELQDSVQYYKTNYMKEKNDQDEFSDLFEDLPDIGLTSEFTISNLLDDFTEEINNSDLETRALTPSEEMYDEIYVKISEHAEKSGSNAQYNLSLSLKQSYEELPVLFNDNISEDSLSDSDKYARRVVCLVAENIWKSEEILTEIYHYQNRLTTSMGLPSNSNYSSGYAIKHMVNFINGVTTGRRRLRIMGTIESLNQLLSYTEENHVDSNNKGLIDSLISDLSYVFGEGSAKATAIKNDTSLQKTILFYYKIYMELKDIKSKRLFNGLDDYSSLERKMINTLVDDYSIVGYLPNQLNILLRNYPSMPGSSFELSRQLQPDELSKLQIYKNALISDESFKSRR